MIVLMHNDKKLASLAIHMSEKENESELLKPEVCTGDLDGEKGLNNNSAG